MEKKPWYNAKRLLGNLLVVCVGIVLYLALSNLTAVKESIGSIFSIFAPFVSAAGIAYLLDMPTRFFEAKVFRNIRGGRGLSVLATYLLFLALLAVLVGLVVPQLGASISTLLGNLPLYFDNFNRFISWLGTQLDIDAETLSFFTLSYKGTIDSIVLYIRDTLPNLLDTTWATTQRIGIGVIGVLTAFIASIYMLLAKHKLLRQSRRIIYALLPKRHADEIMRVGRLSNNVFSGFIGGKIIDSAIIGVICFIFMTIMNFTSIKMPFAPLISVVIGVTNIIPFFGPFIGAIPSVMILLMVNPWSALWFAVFIIILQQFDGNYLGPKILGDTTGLPALWVLVAIIVGGGFFDFLGMLLGVPTMAVIYTLASDFIEKRLRKKNLAEAELAAPPDPPKKKGRPSHRAAAQTQIAEGQEKKNDVPD